MKVDPKILQELEATGLPFTLETGKRHTKIKLAGHLVGICPKSGKEAPNRRALLCTLTQIRRKARELYDGVVVQCD